MPWNRPGLGKWIKGPSWQPYPPIPETLALLAPGARIVDVGAGGRRITADTVAVDRARVPGVDLCADIHQLCLRSDSADCVFSTGTLEHIAEPVIAVDEFWRVLKPGGLVHIEVPFMFPYHQDPGDYTRWTIDGLRAMCERRGFEQVRCGVHMGPAVALNMALIHYARCWFEGRVMRRLSELVLSILLRPHMYLDRFLIRRKFAHQLACGTYFVGRKVAPGQARSSSIGP